MVSFTYDADGLRLTKVVDGVTHYYVWQGDRLVSESYGTSTLEFFYDESGMPYAFYFYDTASTTNNGYYYYVTNLQGDVVGIRDNSGVSKAVYQYNAWGEDIDTSGVVSDIETINPLRYRGYYFDSESGFYYLQSRYYSPEVGRFINADSYASTGQDFLGYNMFAYCNNNPVNCYDNSGSLPCQNTMRMSNDGGGANSLGGTPIIRNRESSHRAYVEIAVSTETEFAMFLFYSVLITGVDIASAVFSIKGTIVSVSAAPATNGLSLGFAAKFLYDTVSSAVGITSDISMLIQGCAEYSKDGAFVIEAYLPTNMLELFDFAVFGGVSVYDY